MNADHLSPHTQPRVNKLSGGMSYLVISLALIAASISGSAAIPLDPDNPGLSDAQRHAQLQRTMDFWSEVDINLDRTALHPKTLGIHLETPQAAFEWVRDQTRPVPYEGVLRNSVGVLQDRQGNSLDRSLLLLEMLEAQGYSVRMARGVINDEAVLNAMDQAWQEPFDPFKGMAEEILDVMARAGDRLNLDRLPDGAIEQYLQDLAADESFWTSAREQVKSELEQQLDADAFAGSQSSADHLDSWREHWWVEYQREGQWIALDPSLADNRPGQTSTKTEETIAPSLLSRDLAHSIEFKIVAEIREGRETSEHVLVETTVLPHELFVPVISVGMTPLSGSLSEVISETAAALNRDEGLVEGILNIEEWLPVIKVGNYVEADKSIFLDGRIRDNPNAFPTGRAMAEASSALGGLLSRGRKEEQPERAWTSMHVDMTHHQPGRPTETQRLTRFDLDNPNWKVPIQAVYGISEEELLVFGALGTESSIFLKHFQPSPYWFVDQLISQLLSNEDLVIKALTDPRFEPDDRDLESLASVPEALMEFLVHRVNEDAIRKHAAVDEIGVLALHQSMMPLNRQQIRFSQTIDLLRHRLAWRAPDGSPSPGGLIDSVNEWRALAGSSSVYSGVMDYHQAAFEGSVGWVLLKNEQQWQGRAEDAAAPAPAVFQQAWGNGRWVLAQPGGSSGSYPVGKYWWDFDPASGDVLIRDLMGHSSASRVRVFDAMQLSFALASPATEFFTVAGITSGLVFGMWGFGDCMITNMNFGCCMAVGMFGFALGYALGAGIGAIKLLGIYAPAVGFSAGVGFDVVTSPFNSALDGVCLNPRWEREKSERNSS